MRTGQGTRTAKDAMARAHVLLMATALLVISQLSCLMPVQARADEGRIAVWRLVDERTYISSYWVEFHGERTVTYTDTSITVHHSLDYAPSSLDGDKKGEHEEYVLYMEWDAPPKTIAVGSEGRLALPVTLRIDEIDYRDEEGNPATSVDLYGCPMIDAGASLAWGCYNSRESLPEEYLEDPEPYEFSAERFGSYRWPRWGEKGCYALQPPEDYTDPLGLDYGYDTNFRIVSAGLDATSETFLLHIREESREDLDIRMRLAEGGLLPSELQSDADSFGLILAVGSSIDAGAVHVYYYELDPNGSVAEVEPYDISVDIDAPQEPGEFPGSAIPIVIVIGGAAAAGIGAVIAGKKRREHSAGSGDRPQEEPRSSYRMVLFKEFGDTILDGDEPRLVGARIEELRPDGSPVDRPDLTGLIRILLSENLASDGTGVHGRYMATRVSSNGLGEGEAAEAVVSFSFTGPGGSLRNNVHFKVKNECELIFAQEALTFIAGAGQRLQMPFGIEGVDLPSGIEPRFELGISTSNAGDFTDLRVIRDEEHPDILWNVEMRECGKSDTLPAGYMESYNCQVTAAIPGARGDRIIRGSYEFYRFHEGIRFSCQHLKAYYVKKDAPDSPQLASGTGDGTAQGDAPEPVKVVLTPARTKATVTFYSWDADNGKLINPIPNIEEIKLSFTDVPGTESFWGREGDRIGKPCEELGFKYFISDIGGDDNTLLYDILPVYGVMQPPNRCQADVAVSLTWEGKSYQAKERVNIISQPYRTDFDTRRAEYEEQDRHREERLTYIKHKILDDPVYGDMMPVYHLIDAMLDGYAPEFGFFEPDWLRVNSLFIRYTTGEIGSIEANDLAFYGRALEYSDAFKMTVQGFNRSIPMVVLRIGCAIKTGGTSEAFFLPLTAIAKGTESSLDCIDKGGESLLEAYRVGVSSASRAALADYLTGKIIEKTVKLTVSTAKLTVSGARALAKKAKVAKDALMMRIKGLFSTGKGAGSLKSAATNVGKQLDDAADAAQKIIDANRDLVYGSKELTARDISYTLGRINGKIKYLDTVKALKRWDKLSRFEQRKIILAVQSDKHAMRALMEETGPLANLVRANHSSVMADIQGKALHMARVSLADKLKVPLSKIRIKTTSGNLAADIRAGKSLSMDMDASFEVLIDGKWVYVKESLGQQHFDKAFFKIARGYDAVDDAVAAMHSKAHDLSIVDGAGVQSYGTYADALRVIKAERAGEAFDDVQRVVKTVEYKNEEWLELARNARADAKAALAQGRVKEAQWLSEAAESFVEEGCRSFTKQTNRAVVNKLIALEKSGVKVDTGNFLVKAKVIERSGIGKNGGTGLTTAEVEVTLENGFNTTLEGVFGELGPMIKKLNHLLGG